MAGTFARPAFGRSFLLDGAGQANENREELQVRKISDLWSQKLDKQSAPIIAPSQQLCYLNFTFLGSPGPPMAIGTGLSVWDVSSRGLPSDPSLGDPSLLRCTMSSALPVEKQTPYGVEVELEVVPVAMMLMASPTSWERN